MDVPETLSTFGHLGSTLSMSIPNAPISVPDGTQVGRILAQVPEYREEQSPSVAMIKFG